MSQLILNMQALTWYFSEEGGIRAIQPNGQNVVFHLKNNTTETMTCEEITGIQDRFVTMIAGKDISNWDCMESLK